MMGGMGMQKWSWCEEMHSHNIRQLRVKTVKGNSVSFTNENDILAFCKNFGRRYYPEVYIEEYNGKQHHYVYKKGSMKKLRLSYYKRNNLEIPTNDYLVLEIDKWNWFTQGILMRIKALYLRYEDGRSCNMRREGNHYLRYSYTYKTWMPTSGYAFFLQAVKDVYIEDYKGKVYMFSYTDRERELLKRY